MTAIVGIIDEKHVWLGGDSAVSSTYVSKESGSPKVFRNGDMLIGPAGDIRPGDLLEYTMDCSCDEHELGNRSVKEFMVTDFVNTLRACYKESGYSTIKDNKEQGNTFLIAFHGQLFVIHSDFSVVDYAEGCAAIGCADEVCYGSLHTTRNMKSSKKRIELALESAAHYSPYVRPPFHILKIKR